MSFESKRSLQVHQQKKKQLSLRLNCLIFNNNCTGVHVIDAIVGVYVGNDNAAKDTNEQGDQKGTVQKLQRNHTIVESKILSY